MKKNSISALIFVAAILLICSSAFAQSDFNAQGRLLLPGINFKYLGTYSYSYTDIYISNTTNETITCKITILDDDGNDATFHMNPPTGIQEIPPYGTRQFALQDRSRNFSVKGQARIEWKSTDTGAAEAITGFVRYYGHAGSASTTMSGTHLINNGHPF